LLDQKYKRGLLRKVFAKLSDSCEKRNLKEVSVLFADGDWIESKDQASDGIRLIQTGNVGFGVYIDKAQNAKYISETTFRRLNCLEIYDDDILISRLPEPAGRACLLPKSTERRITAVDCTVIRTDSSVMDRNYLLQFLCSEQYLKTVNSFLAGGTRQRISRKNLEGIEVPHPSIDEQRYFGSFLCKVDARISNEEQRLRSLSRLRCFMMQQLFI
jgi:type I restriction enzyme S subunit